MQLILFYFIRFCQAKKNISVAKKIAQVVNVGDQFCKI